MQASEVARNGRTPPQELTLDLSFLDEQGGFFRVTATGSTKLERQLDLRSLGVKIDPALSVRITNPTIGLVTEEYRVPIKTALTAGYKILKEHSFQVSVAEAAFQTSVFRWVPDVALERFLAAFEANCERLKSVQAALIADYDRTYARVLQSALQLAKENFARVEAGGSVSYTMLHRGVVEQVTESFPSKAAIAEIAVELHPCVIRLGSDVLREAARSAEARAERDLARIRVQEEDAKARDRVWAQQEELTREARAADTRRRLLEDEQRRVAKEAAEPMKEIVGQFKARISETVRELEGSLQKNGFLHGSSVKAARNLKDYFDMMGSLFDERTQFAPLMARLDAVAKAAQYGGTDVASTQRLLASIASLCYQDAQDVLNPSQAAFVEL